MESSRQNKSRTFQPNRRWSLSCKLGPNSITQIRKHFHDKFRIMPSSTSLLETDEGESEVPPPLVHAFAGMGLEEHNGTPSQTPEQADENLSFHSYHLPAVSHFNLLGTVLDLKPLPLHRPPSGDEGNAAAEDEEPESAVDSSSCSGASLLAQAHLHRHLAPGPGGSVMESSQVETVLLYNGDDRDENMVGSGLPPASSSSGSMAMVPPAVYGELGYEAEPALLNRRKSVNTTECVAVPSSEHVAEIVGRQGKLSISRLLNIFKKKHLSKRLQVTAKVDRARVHTKDRRSTR